MMSVQDLLAATEFVSLATSTGTWMWIGLGILALSIGAYLVWHFFFKPSGGD